MVMPGVVIAAMTVLMVHIQTHPRRRRLLATGHGRGATSDFGVRNPLVFQCEGDTALE